MQTISRREWLSTLALTVWLVLLIFLGATPRVHFSALLLREGLIASALLGLFFFQGCPAPPLKPTLVWGLGSVGVGLLAALSGLRPGFSLPQALLHFGSLMGVGLVLCCIARTNLRLWKNAFILSLLFFLLLSSLFGLQWWKTWFDLGEGGLPPVGYRLRSTFGWPNPNLLVYPITFFLFLALAKQFSVPQRRYERLGWQLLIAWGLLLMAFTGSRGGWLGLASGGLALLWWFRKDLEALRRAAKHEQITFGLTALTWGLYVMGMGLISLWLRVPQPGPSWEVAPVLRRSLLWKRAFEAGWAHLWGGVGPGNFPVWLFLQGSVPPQEIHAHAHNMGLHIWAETGLLGLLFALGGFGFTVNVLWRERRRFTQDTFFALAALLSWITHGLVESCVFFWFPCGVLLWGLWAWLAGSLTEAREKAPPAAQPTSRPPQRAVLLSAIWLALSALGIGQGLPALPWDERAVQATSWEEMGRWFQKAAQRSPIAYENFAGGYALAQAAWEDAAFPMLTGYGTYQDQQRLAKAIQLYREGIAKEPWYAPPWADLGILLWYRGEPEPALQALEEALQRAPYYAPLHLLLGWMRENTGHPEEATRAYVQALYLDPALAESAFFYHPTPTRQQALALSTATLTAFREINQADPCAQGWLLLQHEEVTSAEEAFALCRGHDRYLGLAILGVYQGWPPEQVQAYARLTENPDARQALYFHGFQAEAWFRSGDYRLAVDEYQKAFAAAKALAQGEGSEWLFAAYPGYVGIGQTLVPGTPPVYPSFVVTQFVPHYLECLDQNAGPP